MLMLCQYPPLFNRSLLHLLFDPQRQTCTLLLLLPEIHSVYASASVKSWTAERKAKGLKAR